MGRCQTEEIRQNRGLTLKKVAERAGLKSHSRVSDYESGNYCPNLITLFSLLDAMGATPNEFFRDMPHIPDIGEPARPERTPGIKRRAAKRKRIPTLSDRRGCIETRRFGNCLSALSCIANRPLLASRVCHLAHVGRSCTNDRQPEPMFVGYRLLILKHATAQSGKSASEATRHESGRAASSRSFSTIGYQNVRLRLVISIL